MAKPIRADLIEKPSDWMSGSPDKDKEERNKTKSVSEESTNPEKPPSTDEKAISEIADKILEKFPLTTPTTIFFAGSEWNPHVDETCAQVAYQLANRNVGRVLLVDAEFERSELTKATGTKGLPGVAEIVNKKVGDVDECIADHDEANMDFLPIGGEPIWHWKVAAQAVVPLVANFKSRYQFTCISVGKVHGESARIWSAECDGGFLIVSMTNSSKTVAKSAVDQLHISGARLLGCIVFRLRVAGCV